MVAVVPLCPDGHCSWSFTLDTSLEKGGGGLTQVVWFSILLAQFSAIEKR